MLGAILKQLIKRKRRDHDACRHALRAAKSALRDGDVAIAESWVAQAIAADPASPDAYLMRAAVARRRRRFGTAIEDCEHALSLRPHWAAAAIDLSAVLHDADRFEEALAVLDRALMDEPSHPVLHMNRGLMLRELGCLDEAQQALQSACELDSKCLDGQCYLAGVLADRGAVECAESILVRVLSVDSDHTEAHWQFAMLRLGQGDFTQGWAHYEYRMRRPDASVRSCPLPVWNGASPLNGRLLVLAEQGLGDEIMFASCFQDLLQRHDDCVIECDPRLEGIFTRSFPGAEFRSRALPSAVDGGAKRFAAQIAEGSLPRIFRSRPEDCPAHEGYLRSDPKKVDHWRRKLVALGPGPRIGISWIGGAPKTGRALRSISLNTLAPVFERLNARLISLQFTDCAAEIAALYAERGQVVHQWNEAIGDYDETAALVTALDLVITVNTSVVHLAGALGKPTWMLTPAVVEWRFLRAGNRMPWYPSLRLFRQRILGEWSPVLADVGRELRSGFLACADDTLHGA